MIALIQPLGFLIAVGLMLLFLDPVGLAYEGTTFQVAIRFVVRLVNGALVGLAVFIATDLLEMWVKEQRR